MNGNANLNANNLSENNVKSWRKKLNVPDGAKLYSSIGYGTDGAMTQKATTVALSKSERYDQDFSLAITQDSDLNSFEYTRNGQYYTGGDAISKTLTNCPTEKSFTMWVFNPQSGEDEMMSSNIYKVRKIVDINGSVFIQHLHTTATTTEIDYSEWVQLSTFTKSDILDFIYPVGSYFITANDNLNTAPKVANHFGGTWVQITEKFIYASTTAGSVGGEKTHTLTIDEMPSHNHTVDGSYNAGSPIIGMAGGKGTKWGNVAHTLKTGGSQPHNNMPPYITAYVFRRTA